jgi:deoxyribodipyrimidine photo-lyase
MFMTHSRSFEPTRVAGLLRLQQFVPAASKHYAATRNSDLGPDARTNVSALSPWVRHRLVTEEEILRAVLARHELAAVEKFVQEVFWRTYFKGYLETRPIIWQNYCKMRDKQLAEMEISKTFRDDYMRAIEGRTGIECYDDWVQELQKTGYLHNHARMWFASIWIHTLKLPWELGADFTYRHFLDGDPASNTLSWRWVGGLHTKGKIYLARSDNIATYTQGRYSPQGLARDARILEEPVLPPPSALPVALTSFPAKRFGLVMTEEDLAIENHDFTVCGNPAGCEIAGILSCNSTSERAPLGASKMVQDWKARALEDGMTRAANRLNLQSVHSNKLTADALEHFARMHGVDTLVTPYIPVGPTADLWAVANDELRIKGITLMQVRRPLDTLAWPHATRGFFALKEKIPMLLKELGVHQTPRQLGLFAE